jgi:hypothetical protein
MQLGNRHRPPSRLLTRALLLLAVLTASLTLTHCMKVGDSLNGVNAGLFKRKDDCAAKCQSDFQARNQAEDRLHHQNLAACAGVKSCVDAENARHRAAESASKTTRDACMNGCHQQGGGSSGP